MVKYTTIRQAKLFLWLLDLDPCLVQHTPPPPPSFDAIRPARIYERKHCLQCHRRVKLLRQTVASANICQASPSCTVQHHCCG
ncbi:hypothetical protein B0H34DRAFT_260290 [Crassisporium funariophilum]|nr:hypothetical protein B0H34DRAFT_260290 [Crassisporium funariophilum]